MMNKKNGVLEIADYVFLAANVFCVGTIFLSAIKNGQGPPMWPLAVIFVWLLCNVLVFFRIFFGKKILPSLAICFLIFINFLLFCAGVFVNADPDFHIVLWFFTAGIALVEMQAFGNVWIYSLLSAIQIYLLCRFVFVEKLKVR